MREIKFRAWDLHDERMVEYPYMFEPWDDFRGQNNYGASFVFFEEWRDVDDGIARPCHIMQFTGLHDKNGKEIYEGDWCRAEFRTKDGIQVIQGHIIMDDFMWCIDCTGCVGDDIFSINRPHNFEVIGNVYENPELLNQNI